MDKTICGHERDVLIWALKHADATGDHYVSGDPIPYAIACGEVLDPATLAVMLAERGRDLGLEFWHGPNEPREPSPADYVLYVIDGVIRLYSPLSPKAWQRQYALPQARAILLQWLQLPDGAREEAEKVLRGET